VKPGAIAFWAGTAAIIYGVAVHLISFFRMAGMDYRMAGMPLDGAMVFAMLAIVAGLVSAAIGLTRWAAPRGGPPAGLSTSRAMLFVVLTCALVIDVMKPATLAFVAPGMMAEYHVSKQAIALLPLVALTGTVIGSVLWGMLGDRIGRRGAMVFAALMFMGTSICGTMPSFGWNLAMCFIMGTSAGGMLPVAFTILAECLPDRGRRFYLVLLGGLGSVGGYVAASGLAYLFEPQFGWRVLWLAGLPTGLLLVALSRFVPEPPSFVVMRATPAPSAQAPAALSPVAVWLNVCAFAWSTANFGFIFWLPANFRELGLGVALTDGLLLKSAVLSLVTTPVVALIHQRLQPRVTLCALAGLQGAVLLAFAAFGSRPHAFGPFALTVLIAMLLMATNGLICVLLPFATETFPARFRASGTGMVAGSSKIGGLLPLLVAKLGFVPTLAVSGLFSGALVLVSAGGLLLAIFAKHTSPR
jgi:putative MFS transporter